MGIGAGERSRVGMGEGLFSGFGVAPWALFLAAFAFGLACGWLIWGGRAAEKGDDVPSVSGLGHLNGEPAAQAAPASLDALAQELRAVRTLATESEDEGAGLAAGLAGELDALDESIKRANGRLKLLQRAVQKAGER